MTVDLFPEWTIGDLCLTSYPYGVDADSSVDIGEPGMVTESVQSMLADGDLERVVRYGNRTYSMEITIEGPTLGEVAASEAALRVELSRPGLTLSHDPGDGLTPVSVYEVRTSQLTPDRSDLHESHLTRKFTLTLSCAPFARSADPVTVDSSAAASSPVVITTGGTTTGWSAAKGVPGSPGTSVAVTGGSYVWATASGAGPMSLAMTYTPASPVDMSASRYLLLQMSGAVPSSFLIGTSASTLVDSRPVVTRLLPTGRTLFVLDTGGLPLHRLVVTAYSHTNPPPITMAVYDVSRSGAIPQVSPRQIAAGIVPGGTERTPASLHVSSANGTDPLGLTIVHTCPDDGSGYSPPLQRWRTVGQTRTPDATAYSGNYELINVSSWVAEVPTSALPEGGYTLLARLRCQTASTVRISYSTSTIFPDSTTQQGFTLGQVDHAFAAANVWELVPIAVLSLPSVRTSAGKVQIALQVEAATPSTTLDEAWLFRSDDDCALTIVDTTESNLWLDSPDISSTVPRVWVGDDLATRVHPGTGLRAMGSHVLSQPGTAVFTAAFTDYPQTTATHYRRWPNNAAE